VIRCPITAIYELILKPLEKAIPKGMRRIEHTLTNRSRESKSKDNRNKILVDHNVEETIEKTLELGLWVVSLFIPSLYYHLRAVNIMKKYETEDIMIHSTTDLGVSSPKCSSCSKRNAKSWI
jgi:uncharacterized protein